MLERDDVVGRVMAACPDADAAQRHALIVAELKRRGAVSKAVERIANHLLAAQRDEPKRRRFTQVGKPIEPPAPSRPKLPPWERLALARAEHRRERARRKRERALRCDATSRGVQS